MLVLLIFLLVPPSAAGQVVLDIDPQIDQSKIDLDLWNRVVVPVHDRLTLSVPRTLQIKWGDSHSPGTYDACGLIHIKSYPQDKSDLNNNNYRTLTHVYSHAKFLCRISELRIGAPNLLIEGLAEAEKHLTYQELRRQNPEITGTTEIFRDVLSDNLPRNVSGGGTAYRDNGNAYYESIAAKLERIADILPGRNFNRFYEALSEFRPQNDGEYLAMLDAITGGKSIDGVRPSTFLLRSQAAYLNGPDGTFFGISPLGKLHNSRYSGAETPVNPTAIMTYLRTRESGKPKEMPAVLIRFQWTVKNSSKTVAITHSEMFTASPGNFTAAFNLPGLSTLPDGAYKTVGTACFLNPDNSCSQTFSDTTLFLVHRAEWDAGNDIFVLTNFPRYEDLVSDATLAQFTLPPGVVPVKYPGYIKFQMNGSTEPITLRISDTRFRTITLDATKPRIVFLTDRDQPYLYTATHAATFQLGPLVPGSIATLWTWGATHTDPVQSSTLPLPTSSCDGGQGTTKVVFTGSDARSLEAPFFYCSQQQLNMQVPWELRGPKAKVKIVLNSTPSNDIEVDVAETNPGIFQATWTTPQLGATIFNGGPKDGQLVTPENPAQPGDWLATFATGLGPVDNAPATGEAAKSDPLSSAILPVTVQLNGNSIKPDFVGLAPGFVGLYQINFQLPMSVSSFPNLQPFRLDMGEQVSKQVMLPIVAGQ
ncbi:MAG: hypothetical protein Q8P75_03120 [bacterium]|nr:hypothetical protein [bacterium]